MNRNSGLRVVSLSVLTIFTALAQQQTFEIADVHVSSTARGFAQNFGGVLREGKYVNRDATMLNLIVAAYGVSEDTISGGPGWLELRPVRCDRQGSQRHHAGDSQYDAAEPAGRTLQAGGP